MFRAKLMLRTNLLQAGLRVIALALAFSPANSFGYQMADYLVTFPQTGKVQVTYRLPSPNVAQNSSAKFQLGCPLEDGYSNPNLICYDQAYLEQFIQQKLNKHTKCGSGTYTVLSKDGQEITVHSGLDEGYLARKFREADLIKYLERRIAGTAIAQQTTTTIPEEKRASSKTSSLWFAKTFQLSPWERDTYHVISLLSKSQLESAIPRLNQLTNDPSESVRYQALMGLGKQTVSARGSQSSDANVQLIVEQNQVSVKIDNQLFTKYITGRFDKPILYPINGPGQIPMTRSWPIDKKLKGEAHDHPHHKSMWISHEINGIDFWSEKAGRVVTDQIETRFVGKPKNVMRCTSSWIEKASQQKILSDQTTYWFGGTAQSRWIECQVVFKASEADFQFDDTKEGLFAIRTHPDLRLTANPKQGVKQVFGRAVNSQGKTGKAIWGQPAKWLLYSGKIAGKPVSLLMLDHPDNLRHPTTWHARDYGLIAANPFGMHHFLNKPKGAGAYSVKQGESLALRYRIEFLQGEISVERADQIWQTFAKSKQDKLVPLAD